MVEWLSPFSGSRGPNHQTVCSQQSNQAQIPFHTWFFLLVLDTVAHISRIELAYMTVVEPFCLFSPRSWFVSFCKVTKIKVMVAKCITWLKMEWRRKMKGGNQNKNACKNKNWEQSIVWKAEKIVVRKRQNGELPQVLCFLAFIQVLCFFIFQGNVDHVGILGINFS